MATTGEICGGPISKTDRHSQFYICANFHACVENRTIQLLVYVSRWTIIAVVHHKQLCRLDSLLLPTADTTGTDTQRRTLEVDPIC